MPTYQYACRECGHAFEAVQSFSDDALSVCPVCEGALRKVFNSVGIVFKGSGFYRNDSREKVGAGAKRDDEGKGGQGREGPGKDSGSAGTAEDGGGKDKAGDTSSTSSTGSSAGQDKSNGKAASAGSSSTAGSAA